MTQSNEINGIIDGIGDLLFVIDKDRVIVRVNKATCDVFKKKPEELIGRHCYEIVHGTKGPWCNCPATKTFKNKTSVTEEMNDSNLGMPLLVTTSPILGEQGNVVKVIHVAKDITKIKLAEMESQIAATFFDVASDSILAHDLDGHIVYFNEAAYKTRGYTREEFQTLTIADLEVPGSPRFFEDKLNDILEKGRAQFEAINLCKDKKTLPVEIHSQVVTFDDEKLILSVARDISERNVAEEKLKIAEDKYRTFLTAANVLVQSIDQKGRYVFVNEEWKKILGYSDKDIEVMTIRNVVQKDHIQNCMHVFSQVMNGASIRNIETIFVTKNGREIFVSGNACPIFKNGQFSSTIAFFEDITERKITEKKLEESNNRIKLMNEKLRVVGSLTRHDVRNKLSTVTGYAYLLKKKHSDQTDIVEGLSKMEQAVKDAVKIFEFAKMYEQLGAEELTPINVEAKLNEATMLFSGSLPKIVNECRGLTLLADSFLRQLFYNFIDNTLKYGQKTTIIHVHYQKVNDDCLKLIYEDDGVGILFENKLNLFKEGFSTGGSTGFGLFLTKNMMDIYGWSIVEEGKPGRGVKFAITIPKLNQGGRENYHIIRK